VRYDLIDEREAPPRPVLQRGGKRRLEMDELLEELEVGRVAVVAPIAPAKADEAASSVKRIDTEGLLLEAAAFRGAPVDVWSDARGTVYARLREQGGGGSTA
jgi:hypothetical protein